jgi:hypothetical protein
LTPGGGIVKGAKVIGHINEGQIGQVGFIPASQLYRTNIQVRRQWEGWVILSIESGPWRAQNKVNKGTSEASDNIEISSIDDYTAGSVTRKVRTICDDYSPSGYININRRRIIKFYEVIGPG